MTKWRAASGRRSAQHMPRALTSARSQLTAHSVNSSAIGETGRKGDLWTVGLFLNEKSKCTTPYPNSQKSPFSSKVKEKKKNINIRIASAYTMSHPFILCTHRQSKALLATRLNSRVGWAFIAAMILELNAVSVRPDETKAVLITTESIDT